MGYLRSMCCPLLQALCCVISQGEAERQQSNKEGEAGVELLFSWRNHSYNRGISQFIKVEPSGFNNLVKSPFLVTIWYRYHGKWIFMWDLEGEMFNSQSVYAVLCLCIIICIYVMSRHSEEFANFFQLLSRHYPFPEAFLVFTNFGAIEFFSIISDPVTLSYCITWVAGYTSIIYISQSIRQQWGTFYIQRSIL